MFDNDTTDPRQNPCPDCPEGEVIATGATDPRATQAVCSAACGWEA